MPSPTAHGGGTGGPIEGINITPLVDIMLVLLLIALTAGAQPSPPLLDVSLPDAGAGRAQGAQSTTFTVQIAERGQLSVERERVQLPDVSRLAAAALRQNSSLQATVAADGRAPHAAVIGVLDALQTAGVVRVSFAVSGDASHPSRTERLDE